MEWFSRNLPYLLAGISVGGQYALIAIGYTMVYGILRLINFAHGDIFMVAGLIMVYAIHGYAHVYIYPFSISCNCCDWFSGRTCGLQASADLHPECPS